MTKYSKEEIDRIKELNAQGFTPKEIAKYFPNRSYDAVTRKIHSMNLKVQSINKPIIKETFDEKLCKKLLDEKHTITELANFYDVGPKTIEETISRLKKKGYNLALEEETVSIKKTTKRCL